MSIVVLDEEEVKVVLDGGDPVNSVNLFGYKSYLKEKYPGSVLYTKYDDLDIISNYLEVILDNNQRGNTILLPYYEGHESVFPDYTDDYFTGVIVDKTYVQGSMRVPFSNIVNTFIEVELLTGNLHIGNVNFNRLVGNKVMVGAK